MLDIVEIPEDGSDLVVADSAVPKAANVLSVQLGSLEYAQDFGVDMRFFITSPFQFQNESFKAYLIERLTQAQINVTEVIETVERLFKSYNIGVSSVEESNSGGLIA